MNQQKLNELAERAWAYQITVYEDNGVRTYGEQDKVFSKQKFAELIVQECIDIAINAASDTNFITGISKEDKRALSIAVEIRNHFGVNE